MRKLLTIVLYTLIVLLIGRNLPMLPRFSVFSTPQQAQDRFVYELKRETKRQTDAATGNYGVFYADITKPYAFGLNHKEIFTAASVNKVPIVAVLYHLDHKGKLDLDEKITIQKNDMQLYGTGSIQYQKPGVVYSLKTLARLAMQQSDNTAAHVLAKRIGMPTIQTTIEDWGLTQTDMEDNKTSPYDMYLLFRKIYNAELTNVAKTQELLGFMVDTDIEDRLPADMPGGVNVYHKTGDNVGALHDVGIIWKDDTVFFLAVMTSDIGNKEKETKETIANIARSILDAYSREE